MKRWKAAGMLALSGMMLLGSSLAVCAEEREPAGYHVYETEEDEATDTWYGIERGAYLKAGMSKVAEGDKSGYAVAGGYTLAQQVCDRVYVRIYLDKSDTGTGSWGTVDYWTGIATDAGMSSASSGQYKITKKKYYRARGVHSVTQDDYTETTTTCTDALPF